MSELPLRKSTTKRTLKIKDRTVCKTLKIPNKRPGLKALSLREFRTITKVNEPNNSKNGKESARG